MDNNTKHSKHEIMFSNSFLFLCSMVLPNPSVLNAIFSKRCYILSNRDEIIIFPCVRTTLSDDLSMQQFCSSFSSSLSPPIFHLLAFHLIVPLCPKSSVD